MPRTTARSVSVRLAVSLALLAPLVWLAKGAVTSRLVAQSAGQAAPSPVPTFAGNPQHTGLYGVPGPSGGAPVSAMDLNAVRWTAPVDLAPANVAAHYGAPVITAANTVLVPVKTTAAGGFQVQALRGGDGTAVYPPITSDYLVPPHGWFPTFGPALATHLDGPGGDPVTRLYYPGAGGTVYYVEDPDSPSHGPTVRQVFYGAYDPAFDATVFVNTPITADSAGNVYFGVRVLPAGPLPGGVTGDGYVRLTPDGAATYVSLGTVPHNAAPALSVDESTLYVVAGSSLVGLDSTTLATKPNYTVTLRDPRSGALAWITDDSTASPTVGPDGDVYYGVLGNPFNGSRGFLLHFSADLQTTKTPGGFGWDYTAAIVPRSMVPSYVGTSSYLIFAKYNNYAFSDGNGVNRVALLDPNATQIDPHDSAGGLAEMREVLTMAGPTPDAEHFADYPDAVREWCINTAAVNPATGSIFFPSEDGRIYRWDVRANALTQAVELAAGIGEPYVPTVMGPDGTVYTMNGGTLFALGTTGGVSTTLVSSDPDARAVAAGESLTFTATVKTTNTGLPATGSVTFHDDYYPYRTLQATTDPAFPDPLPVALDQNGQATSPSVALAAGVHFVTATYVGATTSKVTFVQKVHPLGTTTVLSALPSQPAAGESVTFTATVAPDGSAPGGMPTGMVTFTEHDAVLAQVPLSAGSGNSTANFTVPVFGNSSRTITATYASDPQFARSSGSATVSVAPTVLTVTGITANPREYDGTTAASLDTSAATLVGVASGDTVMLEAGHAEGAFADRNVGNAKPVAVSGLTLTGPSAGHYTLAQPTTAGNITPRTVTATVTAPDKTYDATTAATILSASLANTIVGDDVALVVGSASFDTPAAGVGKTVTATGLGLQGVDAANYALASTTATTTATIDPRPVTVT
ncbi:MAG: YDG domain-containing protein, partial [Acidobacteriota bacterium]